jgi:hypothetical protein
MQFFISQSIEILERTPNVLIAMVQNLRPEWTSNNEGEGTWSVYDIVGHLIHGEKTDWVPRSKIILSDNVDKKFEPFDRFAQFENSKGKSLTQLLHEFKNLREENMEYLCSLTIDDASLQKKGIHPAFGEVTLSQLLATWVVHDLNHISQIARVMANQYKEATGPWIQYLGILQR